jgi:membrane fusion protein (multidrug efflux system)
MLFAKWNRHLTLGAILICGLLLASCKPKMSAPPPGMPEVAVETVQPAPLVLTTELPGRTAAYLVAEIRPQVNGIIQKRFFEEGANVKAGDTLYQIDPVPYEATLAQARAALATSEADLVTAQANLPALESRVKRYAELVPIHAIGQQDYDDAVAALTQARATVNARRTAVDVNRAAVETAKINLSYTPIKAPISGRIGRSTITVGALATAYQGAALAVIQQLDPIYVDVVQANAELLRLRHNLETGRLRRDGAGERKVKLLLEDGSTYAATGRLQFRDVTVDPTTGAVSLRMVFSNPREVLLPGTFVRAVVEEGLRQEAIQIPQQAVMRDPKGNPYSLVLNDQNKVERRGLDLERAIGDKWLVMKGVGAGDRLVVEGGEKVRPGMAVRVVPAKPAAAPGAGKEGGHV